jgi:peptidoglycan/xylan/chitin deacetylase (PgdA/CDA1 family)
MRIPFTRTFRRAAARLERLKSRQALILMYHRVTDLEPDPWRLCVSPARFAEHLDVLSRHARPLQLRRLTRCLRDGEVPRKSVVVTFDDGYADNLHNAKPLLERFGVPATVFVASGAVGSDREFWWDELARVLLTPGLLPPAFSLSLNGKSYEWHLGKDCRYDEDSCRRDRGWLAWGDVLPTSRHDAFRKIYELMHPLSPDERRQVQDNLLAWAGLGSAARAAYGTLSPDDLDEMARGGLIEVGAHTVTHPLLAALPPARQRQEIRQSKAQMESLLNRRVASFAYPYGRREDYSPATVEIVREAGFDCACSNFAGAVKQGADMYQLPRMHVQDWGGEEFSRRLRDWFES